MSATSKERICISPQLFYAAIARFEPYTLPAVETGIVEGRVWLHNGSVYTGSFQNGSMTGNGVLEWPDRTIFRGNFRNNSPNGTGEIIWTNSTGHWSYRGEFQNGLRDGKGEIKSVSHGVSYSGFWKHGLRNGHGICRSTTTTNGDWKYEGEYLDGQRHGIGSMIYPSGSVYGGGWKDGKRNGYGIMVWTSPKCEMYAGEWLDGVPHGMGSHYYGVPLNALKNASDAALGCSQIDPFSRLRLRLNCYKGEWKAGERHGNGTFLYADGSRYAGEWTHNEKDGNGLAEFSDGRTLSGIFSHGHCNSQTITTTTSTLPQPSANSLAVLHRFYPEFKSLYDSFSSNLNSKSTNFGKRFLSSEQLSRVIHCLKLDQIDEESSDEFTTLSLHVQLLRKIALLLPNLLSKDPFSQTETLVPHEFVSALLCCFIEISHSSAICGANPNNIDEMTSKILTQQRISEAIRINSEVLNPLLPDDNGDEVMLNQLRKVYDRFSQPENGTVTIRDVLKICSIISTSNVSVSIQALKSYYNQNAKSNQSLNVSKELCFFEFRIAISICSNAIFGNNSTIQNIKKLLQQQSF